MKKTVVLFQTAAAFLLILQLANAKEETLGVENALKGSNYLAARRVLRVAVEKTQPKDPILATEWSKSLMALVSLERLMGDEAEARKQFFRCNSGCAKHVANLEWENFREWACKPLLERRREICRQKKRKP